MKNKKKWIIGAAIVLALVCLLPLPRRIEKSYYAQETNSGAQATISLKINLLDFLLLDDIAYGERVFVQLLNREIIFDRHDIYDYDFRPPSTGEPSMHRLYAFRIVPIYEGTGTFSRIFASPDFSMFLLQEGDLQFAGHVQEGKFQDVLNFFEFYIK